MKLDEIENQEWYVLVANDGTPQIFSLSPDFETCVGMIGLLASKGICRSLSLLFDEGYEVLPIKLSILQNGTAEEGFQKAKQKLV